MVEEQHCTCDTPPLGADGEEGYMVECSACSRWFHGGCVNLPEHEAAYLQLFHCPGCVPTNGASTRKRRSNWHRHDYSEPDASRLPVQCGTSVFVRALIAWPFASAHQMVTRLRGCDVTLDLLQSRGFKSPIVISDSAGLELRVPESSNIMKVRDALGPDYMIDVIDSERQETASMSLAELAEYFSSDKREQIYDQLRRERVYNLISLEYSDTDMSCCVDEPLVVRQLSWAHTVWPAGDLERPPPRVSKYCLVTAAHAYTDFHVDFGGSSVWYHVCWGEKVFYLAPPTPENLSLYERWTSSPTRSQEFFVEQVNCYELRVQAGETVLLPAGWIHAVYTPCDSFVYGGNFIHSLSVPEQLKIHELERRVGTAEKFLFPNFKTLNWLAAADTAEELVAALESGESAPLYLVVTALALRPALNKWHDGGSQLDCQLPKPLTQPGILRDLNRAIKLLEKRHQDLVNAARKALLSPLWPTTETKRGRKRLVNGTDKQDVQLTAKLSFAETAVKILLNSDEFLPHCEEEVEEAITDVRPDAPLQSL